MSDLWVWFKDLYLIVSTCGGFEGLPVWVVECVGLLLLKVCGSGCKGVLVNLKMWKNNILIKRIVK